jgi:hypothetical protein
VVLQRPLMESGDRRVQLLADLTDRARADRSPEDRQQRLGHLARRQAEDEAGEDHAVDVAHPAAVGLDHPERAEGPRARHRELERAELGQQPAPIAAVAPVGLAAFGHGCEVPVDRYGHAGGEHLNHRRTSGCTVVFTPFHAFGLHGLHHSKRGW